ncbi:MAG: DUF6531 domain-containing protein, partial [Planctomycetota bacterium]
INWGPAELFDYPNILNPTATFNMPQKHVLKLTVEDEDYASNYHESKITVHEKELPPIVEAGNPQTIKWPVNTVCLSDAFIEPRSDSQLSVEWLCETVDGGLAKFLTSSIQEKPILQFSSPGTYHLTVTVTYQINGIDQEPISDSVIIAVRDEGGTIPDSNGPELLTFTIDSQTISDDVNDPEPNDLSGQVNIYVRASDKLSGMSRLILGLDFDGESFILLKEENIDSQLRVEDLSIKFTLNTTYLSNGEHNLVVIAYDAYDDDNDPNTDERNYTIQTGYFEVANGGNNAADPPVAKITNSIFYEDGDLLIPKENPLPIISDGFFGLSGTANHDNSGGIVKYKIELFDPEIASFKLEDWSNLTLYDKYCIKNVTALDPNEEEYHVGRVNDDTLATLDLTGVQNAAYRLLLTVKYENGVESYAYANVGFILDSPLKIGNVRFSQEDLVIPVGGFPLTVIRTYDSLNRKRDGDFGYGWSYSIVNMEAELDEERITLAPYYPLGSTLAPVRFGSNYSRNVTLTLPDGKRTTFYFTLEKGIEDWLTVYRPKYIAPPGVYAELKVLPENEKMNAFGLWTGQGYGFEGIEDAANYDFEGYKLTTEDGTSYYFSRQNYCSGDGDVFENKGIPYWANPRGPLYLDYLVTTSGEKVDLEIDFSDIDEPRIVGLEHYLADGTPTKTVKTERYNIGPNTGRIKAVYPPSELDISGEIHSGSVAYVKYTYDAFGNLSVVEKLEDRNSLKYQRTTFSYEDESLVPQEHYITSIKDSRGLTPIRYVYDDKGRLESIIDGRDREIKIGHDGYDPEEGRYEEITNRSENKTTYFYNSRGNVTLTVDAKANITEYSYEDDDNPDRPTSVTTYVPDANDSNVSIPAVTYYSYGNHTNEDGYITGLNRQMSLDPVGNVTETYYDYLGNVTQTIQGKNGIYDSNTIDYNNVVTKTTYTYEGSLLRRTDINDPNTGACLQWTKNFYDEKNRLTQVRTINPDNPNNPDGIVLTTYAYDQAESNSYDQPYSVTDAAGSTQYFYYDDDGRQTQTGYDWVDPNDEYHSYSVDNISIFDDAGRIVETQRQITEYYNSVQQGDTITITLSETIYDDIGKPDTSYDEHGNATTYDYDEMGNLVQTSSFDPNGNLLTISRTFYDDDDRPVVTVGPYDPFNPNSRHVGSETVYDSLGRASETRRWADIEIQIGDIFNDSEEVVGKRATGWTVDTNGPLSYTKTIYDIAGRVKMTIDVNEAGYEIPTSYEYDLAGRQKAVIDPCGHDIVYILEGSWHVIDINNTTLNGTHRTKTDYDGQRRKSATDALGRNTSFKYDTLGRIIRTKLPATEFYGSSGAEHTYTHTGYDILGRRIWQSKQDPNALPDNLLDERIRDYYYDSAGRLSAVELEPVDDPCDSPDMGETVRPRYDYFYDIYGNLCGILDPNERLTVFEYNHLYQLAKRYMPFKPVATITSVEDIYALDLSGFACEIKGYDDFGRIEMVVDFEGQVAGFEYDYRGRLEYKKYYDDETHYIADDPNTAVQYVYDNLGRKRQVIEERGTTKYYYDDEGQIVKIDSPEGTISYEYSSITGRKVRTWTDFTEIKYEYDRLGRLKKTKLTKRDGSALQTPEVTTYKYDDVGNRDSAKLANGVVSDYSYDELYRLTDLSYDKSDAGNLSSFTYTLLADGMRKSLNETLKLPVGDIEQHTVTYSYDNLNRLINETAKITGSSTNTYTGDYIYDLV